MTENCPARCRHPALSVLSTAAFAAATVTAIVSTDNIAVLAKCENRAPDGSGELFLLRNPVQRGGGKLAFTTTLRENGITVGAGVYRVDSPGNVVQIMREGDAASDGTHVNTVN